jgi:hypothetical protein
MIDREPRVKAAPRPEPAREPFDPHLPPLDDEDDVRHLLSDDPRRVEIMRRRAERGED